MTYDAAIIGAGIVGAACADALTEAGASVIVIEPNIVGGGATAAGMGHIAVMDDSEAQFALTNFSRQLWLNLVPRMPPAVEFEQRGALWVAADEEELAAVRTKLSFYAHRGVRAQMLNETELREAEPNLRHGLAGGLLVPGDAVIYAPCAAAWLLERAVRHGAKLQRGIEVDQLRKDCVVLAGGLLVPGDAVIYAPCAAAWLLERAVRRGAKLQRGIEVDQLRKDSVVLAGGPVVSAKAIICAAGADALRWFPRLDIKPRKGHLAITGRYPGFVNHQLIELGYLKSAHDSTADSVAFNVQPRATGQILVGSSRQFGGDNGSIDPHMLRNMMARAVAYMPALAGLQVIRTWTGFRAATSDSLPIIGLHEGLHGDNVYLATGHEGLGITTSLGTAHLITAAVLGLQPAIDPAPYLPGRGHRH